MIRAELVAVYVNTGPLFVFTGSVNAWTRGVARELNEAAFAFAPKRTGELAHSIHHDVTAIPVLRTIHAAVGTDVPYGRFVHEGTPGPIYTRMGWANRAKVDAWLDLGASRPANPVTGDLTGYLMPVPGTRGRARVRGQTANPYLVNGYRAVRAHHRSLPRLDPLELG